MCGTCKYGFGFFQLAALWSLLLIGTGIAILYFYGGMPPTWPMQIGFWLLIMVGWLSVYLTLYIVRVVGKGVFNNWILKYCFIMIIITIIFYTAVSVCFFIPVTKGAMISYSKAYYMRGNKYKVPRFLDAFQDQYHCCGINNYLDYGDDGIFANYSRLDENATSQVKIRVRKTRLIQKGLTPDSEGGQWFSEEEQVKKGSHHFIARTMHYFEVPRSCCATDKKAKYPNCGQFVEDFGEQEKKDCGSSCTPIHPNADMVINNVSEGCFKKYERIMKGASSFQLNWMLGVLQIGSCIQAFAYLGLIWLYRHSLVKLKSRMRMEDDYFMDDEDDDDESITVDQDDNDRKGSKVRKRVGASISGGKKTQDEEQGPDRKGTLAQSLRGSLQQRALMQSALGGFSKKKPDQSEQQEPQPTTPSPKPSQIPTPKR